MIYEDEKLEKKYLGSDNPLAEELNRRIAMGVFIPSEEKSFYENLREKYIFDLRKKCLEEITNIKRLFLSETGESL